MMKMKMALMDSPPSYAYDVEAKSRFKLQSLLQDFEELEKETKEMKRKLQKAKRKKVTLLAEVRFLRRRYKFLLKNPSQKISHEFPAQPQFQNIKTQGASKERNCGQRKAINKRIPAIDLNQISRGDEMEEFIWEARNMEKKSKRSSIEGDALAGDMRMVCRDVGHGSLPSRKRKISWQDQVALRV